MTDAIEAQPGTDPDRASSTSALEAARDQLTAAAGICPDHPAGQPGVIGRAVLATLLPARRPRYSARLVKCATSRYHENDGRRPPRSPQPSPQSTSPCTPRPSRQARLAAPATPPGHHARTSHPPAGSASQRSSPASRHGTGAAANSPTSWASSPATCTPSSANGPSSGFFTRTGYGIYALNTPGQNPRQMPPDLNSAALPAVPARNGLDGAGSVGQNRAGGGLGPRKFTRSPPRRAGLGCLPG